MQLCLDMNRKWEALNREKDPDEIDSELEAIKRAFSNFDELGFKGEFYMPTARLWLTLSARS